MEAGLFQVPYLVSIHTSVSNLSNVSKQKEATKFEITELIINTARSSPPRSPSVLPLAAEVNNRLCLYLNYSVHFVI